MEVPTSSHVRPLSVKIGELYNQDGDAPPIKVPRQCEYLNSILAGPAAVSTLEDQYYEDTNVHEEFIESVEQHGSREYAQGSEGTSIEKKLPCDHDSGADPLIAGSETSGGCQQKVSVAAGTAPIGDEFFVHSPDSDIMRMFMGTGATQEIDVIQWMQEQDNLTMTDLQKQLRERYFGDPASVERIKQFFLGELQDKLTELKNSGQVNSNGCDELFRQLHDDSDHVLLQGIITRGLFLRGITSAGLHSIPGEPTLESESYVENTNSRGLGETNVEQANADFARENTNENLLPCFSSSQESITQVSLQEPFNCDTEEYTSQPDGHPRDNEIPGPSGVANNVESAPIPDMMQVVCADAGSLSFTDQMDKFWTDLRNSHVLEKAYSKMNHAKCKLTNVRFNKIVAGGKVFVDFTFPEWEIINANVSGKKSRHNPNRNKFNEDRVEIISKIIAWLLGDPLVRTIEAFQTYCDETGCLGLLGDEYDTAYKCNVLTIYASQRRSQKLKIVSTTVKQ